ncbi:hypothetical protein ALC152_07260 [Arcobacter sp. 15-2]|uniref:hypothetical protein n=1 Tax=Arcobacter sp. 15-2 TaxID=3374109 RepID=UPI00399CF2C0
MKIIVALEELIKENETVIKSIKKQLGRHESGESKLSYMGLASAETNLEKAQEQLSRNKERLKEYLALDMEELVEKEKVRDAIERKNYLNYQKIRINRDITKKNDEKLEAMLILDELKEDFLIEDEELFEIASKSIDLGLTLHIDLQKKIIEVKNEFESALKNIEGENISDLGMLNFRCVLTIVHLHVLRTNIQENIEEDKLPPFRGFPKFEDWWIKELWSNHQAYYGLYKWKQIISKLCITHDQKRAWDIVFSNWISIKKIITDKATLGYEYNYIFDQLIRKHSELEEELATSSLKSMSELTKTIIAKENFSLVPKEHTIITDFVKFKRNKLNYKDVKKLNTKGK